MTKTRTDLLNFLAQRYGLISYLEIGVQDPKQNFDKIICPQKVSVDPDPNANAMWEMTSNEFFDEKNYHGIVPDLVFIDGMHTAEQVMRDVWNALDILAPKGFIVVHDCNPAKEEHTIVPRPTKTGHWNGDVYKFAATLSINKFTVDIDNGCMVIPYNKQFSMESRQLQPWSEFDKNREELLNLISWDEFISMRTHS